MEVIGAISAVIGILNTAIDISQRVLDATDKKSFRALLDRNKKELVSLNEILQVVKNENGLQTQVITSEIMRMGSLGEELQNVLNQMERQNKNSLQQFGNRLANNSKDKQKLNELSSQIMSAKHNLILKIQTAHVGLTKTTGDAIVANTETILNVNRKLQGLIKDFDGLEIADLIRHRKPRGIVENLLYSKVRIRSNSD